MRTPLALALSLAFALPLAALAEDEDEDQKPHELKLLPKAEEGQEERLAYDVSLQVSGEGGRSDSIDLTLRRKIDATDGGLPSRETFTVEKFSMNGEDPPLPVTTVPIIRPNKARQATIAPGGPDVPTEDLEDENTSEFIVLLRRDPDGLARVLAPKGKKKTGEEWTPDVASLLLLLAPGKAKLAEGSSARAKLVSVKRLGDGTPLAEVSLEATLLYTFGEDGKTTHTIKATGKLEGPPDGSAPPSKEQLTLVVSKEGDDGKRTVIAKLERTPLPREKKAEDGEKKPEDEKKKDGKPDEKEPF